MREHAARFVAHRVQAWTHCGHTPSELAIARATQRTVELLRAAYRARHVATRTPPDPLGASAALTAAHEAVEQAFADDERRSAQ